RPLSPDSLAFIASPAGIFSAPHFHSRFPEVPYNKRFTVIASSFKESRIRARRVSFDLDMVTLPGYGLECPS
ncbi:MAG: hypothetical protein ACI8XO_003402, partial [Verrucomicrobiales bacterium]